MYQLTLLSHIRKLHSHTHRLAHSTKCLGTSQNWMELIFHLSFRSPYFINSLKIKNNLYKGNDTTFTPPPITIEQPSYKFLYITNSSLWLYLLSHNSPTYRFLLILTQTSGAKSWYGIPYMANPSLPLELLWRLNGHHCRWAPRTACHAHGSSLHEARPEERLAILGNRVVETH